MFLAIHIYFLLLLLFPFIVLNVSLSSGLRVSSVKSFDSLMGVPLYVIHCFFHASFKSLSLFLIFVILVTVCLSVFLFGLILYGTVLHELG